MARKPVVPAALQTLMLSRRRHAWTLEDLHAGLAENGVSVNFSTIFRAAEKLAGDGIVRKLVLDDGRARFELLEAHHDHLLCTRCGELVPIPCLIADRDVAGLERDAGISIGDHQLVVNGLCRECCAATGSAAVR